MSTDTEQSETVREIAGRVLASLGQLEAEHSEWLSAVAVEDRVLSLESAGLEADEQDVETLALYRERSEFQGEYLSDLHPVWLWLESVLDVATIWESRGGSTPERRGWEILLGYGGPSIGLELRSDGHATVWAAHWSPTERAYGQLEWLADWLWEAGL